MSLSRRETLFGLGALACTRAAPRAGNPAPMPPEGPVEPAWSTVQPLREGFHRGLSYAHLHVAGHGYGSERSLAQLGALAARGIREVALMPFAYMPALDGPEVRFGGDGTLDDDALLAEARQAATLGIRVMIKPHLWARSFSWGSFPGDIEMRSPEAWKAWFRSYTDYAVANATVAEAGGAAAFCVGTECTRASLANPGAWAEVAAAVRKVFRGPITYGANWNEEVFGFHDWSAFDYIGVNAYFPLSDEASPSLAALLDGWRPVVARLSGLSAAAGRPVIFTEAGYEAVTGAATKPWGAGSGTADPALQARAYEALMRSLGPQPWFAGVYWWKWFTDGAENPWDRSAYCPEPEAMACVQRWFQAS